MCCEFDISCTKCRHRHNPENAYFYVQVLGYKKVDNFHTCFFSLLFSGDYDPSDYEDGDLSSSNGGLNDLSPGKQGPPTNTLVVTQVSTVYSTVVEPTAQPHVEHQGEGRHPQVSPTPVLPPNAITSTVGSPDGVDSFGGKFPSVVDRQRTN